MKKPLFCFIDDADFELQTFRELAAPCFEGVEFVYATTFAQAKEALGKRRPHCFLLDLYGTDPALETPRIPDQEELAEVLGEPPTLEPVYHEELGQGTEMGNAFLRRLYTQVDRWQQSFLFAAGLLGQGLVYGLANLASVRAAYPWAAAVGYTRKSLFVDAVKACRAEIDGLLQKPQGPGGEITQATKLAAPDLAATSYRAVDGRLAQQVTLIALKLAREPDPKALVAALVEGLQHLGVAALGEPTRPPLEVAGWLNERCREANRLTALEMESVLALADWLEYKDHLCQR